MRSPVASRRLALVAAARSRRAEFLHIDPGKLRFSLGTSLGDLRIPVHVAADAEAIIRAAAAELALLLSAHHRFVPPGARDRIVMHELYAALPAALPRLGPTSGGASVRTAATLGPTLHPALTGGIVCAWMGPGGRGRSLTALFIEVLRRAFAEMAATSEGEPTPLLVTLALHAELVAAESSLRDALPAPPHDRYLRAAAAAGLWIAAATGVERAWRETGRPDDDPLRLEMDAALSPGTILGLRPGRAGGDTLYGAELLAGVPRADELSAAIADGGDPDTTVGAVAQALAADEDLGRKAEVAVVLAHVRDALSSAVVETEAVAGDRLGWLRELLAAPSALAVACGEEGSRRDLARRVEEAAAPGDAARLLASAAQALKTWRAREPSVAIDLDPGMSRREYARVAGGYLADAALERIAGPARRATVARTGEEAEGGAEAEWEAGRLYRVAVQGEILRPSQQTPLGHLFADVKDFTRRTGLLGPAAMAEFLRSEFYRPILGAAKKFFSGMSHLADRGGVSVNNLLGDAISLSGDIEAMVGLAGEIRRLLAAYESRLRSEISRDAVARQLAAIEQRHAAGLAKVSGALALAKQDLAKAAPGTPQHARAAARAAWLAAIEERLSGERERALARARGEGLEAGVFVSFGAPPLVVIVDDDVFGANRVAIAEKINESARGTARQAFARARADAELAEERASRKVPDLAHAWSVWVDRPLEIRIPPTEERQALAAARAGDMSGALRTLSPPVRTALQEAVRDSSGGDIYNAGAALSEEALGAWLQAVADSRVVRRVKLEIEHIPEALRSRWFFGRESLDLVLCFHTDGKPAELFRRAGVASFKGLGDVVVWELAGGGDGPAELVKALAAT